MRNQFKISPDKVWALKIGEVAVEGVEGEAHDVVVAAVDAADAYAANPFLDAVGAGFVEGAVAVDVTRDGFWRESVEGDEGGFGKGQGLFG